MGWCNFEFEFDFDFDSSLSFAAVAVGLSTAFICSFFAGGAMDDPTDDPTDVGREG
jgi:hypothetical protein